MRRGSLDVVGRISNRIEKFHCSDRKTIAGFGRACVNVQTSIASRRILARLNEMDDQGNAMKHHVAMMCLLASALACVRAHSAEPEGVAKDAWIEGTLETIYALNPHLKAFAIDTEVDGGIVHLTGKVSYDIDRDLAGELARKINGVVEVDNGLVVTPDANRALEDVPPAGVDRSFGTWTMGRRLRV